MADPVSLIEARLFLRVSHDDEDGLISTFLEAARARIEGATGLTLSDASPAPLRLSVLHLVAQAYQNRGEAADLGANLAAVEPWLKPYREVRL